MKKQHDESRKLEEVTNSKGEEKTEEVEHLVSKERLHKGLIERFLELMKLDDDEVDFYEEETETSETDRSKSVWLSIGKAVLVICVVLTTLILGHKLGYESGYVDGFHIGTVTMASFDLLLLDEDIPDSIIDEFAKRMFELIENPTPKEILEFVDDITTILFGDEDMLPHIDDESAVYFNL